MAAMLDQGPSDPALLRCACPAFDTDFHPLRNCVAVGLVSGHVELHEFSPEAVITPPQDVAAAAASSSSSSSSSSAAAATAGATLPAAASAASTTLRLSIQPHASSCRATCFDADGAALYTGSSDMSLCALDTTGKISWRAANAHGAPVNCLKAGPPRVFVSGDDDGVLKVWDVRQAQRPVLSLDCHQDFVSEVAFNAGYTRAISAGGDGSICAINLRAGKIQKKSELLEDEQLSVAIMKGGKKVVTGTQTGVLNIWTWGKWEDISDRFPGHPQSVQSIVKIDEDTLLTGSSDGIIRIVQIHPNKLLGMVGEHEEDFPIEKLCLTRDRRIVSSISHDNCVRLWSVAHLGKGGAASYGSGGCGGGGHDMEEEDDDSDMDGGSSGGGFGAAAATQSFKKKPARADDNAGFFDDM
jgi:WD40 repeat protein